MKQFGIAYWEDDFDAMTQVTAHEVGATEVNFLGCPITEVVGTTVFQNRPTMLETRMLSLNPLTKGRKQQSPRTKRSTFTPACEAR